MGQWCRGSDPDQQKVDEHPVRVVHTGEAGENFVKSNGNWPDQRREALGRDTSRYQLREIGSHIGATQMTRDGQIPGSVLTNVKNIPPV